MKQFYLKTLFSCLFVMAGQTIMAYYYDVEVDGIFYDLNKNNQTATVTSKSYEDGGYTGDITIPESFVSDGVTYRVTSIGSSAFYRCTGLSNVTIPNSVTSIGSYAFYGCTVLADVELPDNIWIDHDAFSESVKLHVVNGSATLLCLWANKYTAYEKGKETVLTPPTIKIWDTTQSTAEVQIKNINRNYTYEIDGNKIAGPDVTSDRGYVVHGLRPDYDNQINVVLSKEGSKNTYVIRENARTKGLKAYISADFITGSAVSANCYRTAGDAEIVEKQILLLVEKTEFDYSLQLTVTRSYKVASFEGDSIRFMGLDPRTSYCLQYSIKAAYGDGETMTVYAVKYFKTTSLVMTTHQPKVASPGNVVVSALTNLDDEETNVGFEWRRTDWTDDFASNTGGAYLFSGAMEGYIRNLNADKLWKYRPYYVSKAGQTYYGEWVGIDPTNTSYFEPTVHTYAAISVTGNTAQVKGYAMRGSDRVARQGFKYWKVSSQGSSLQANGPQRASAIPSDALVTEVEGTIMIAELKDLEYDSQYCCVAFVTTDEGESFYGEPQLFVTGVNNDAAGIGEIVNDGLQGKAFNVYNLSGVMVRHHVTSLEGLPRGIYIVNRKKVFVR